MDILLISELGSFVFLSFSEELFWKCLIKVLQLHSKQLDTVSFWTPNRFLSLINLSTCLCLKKKVIDIIDKGVWVFFLSLILKVEKEL